jgi:hypothetical protein
VPLNHDRRRGNFLWNLVNQSFSDVAWQGRGPMQWLRLNTALLFTPHWRDFSISRLSDFDADAGKEAGLHHMAFTFKSLRELLDTYTRLKESGIRPNWCINHGPTTSM